MLGKKGFQQLGINACATPNSESRTKVPSFGLGATFEKHQNSVSGHNACPIISQRIQKYGHGRLTAFGVD
jgi:hypothetical protein